MDRFVLVSPFDATVFALVLYGGVTISLQYFNVVFANILGLSRIPVGEDIYGHFLGLLGHNCPTALQNQQFNTSRSTMALHFSRGIIRDIWRVSVFRSTLYF